MLRTFYRSQSTNKELDHFHDAFNGNGAKFTLDKIGIVQFILFRHCLYDRTFLEDVKFKYSRPDGSKFELNYAEDRHGYNPKNEERLWELLNETMKGYFTDGSKFCGIGNSGGLDSRFVMYIASKLKANVYPYTIGDAPSDAIHIANRVAGRLGLKNHHYPVEPNYLKLYAEQLVQKRPMYPFSACWWLSARKALPDFDLVLTGFYGGALRGVHLHPVLRVMNEKDALYKHIYSFSNFRAVSENDLAPLLIDGSLFKESFEDFRAQLSRSRHHRPENISDEFVFHCRELRFIMQSPSFDYLDRFSWKSPYYNDAFMNFASHLTYEERIDEQLFNNTARRFMKELRNIRFERSPFSLSDQNVFIRKVKNKFWHIDCHYNLRLYFKGIHKAFNGECLNSENYEYIKNVFAVPNEFFNRIFNYSFLMTNLDQLINRKYDLVLNLLAVKIWMDIYKNYLK